MMRHGHPIIRAITSFSACGALLLAMVEAFWLAIRRALNSRQSVSACDAGRLSGMPSFLPSGFLEPSLLSEFCLQKANRLTLSLLLHETIVHYKRHSEMIGEHYSRRD